MLGGFRRNENSDSARIPRQAYLFRSLKRPEEVSALRRIYASNLVVLGIHAGTKSVRLSDRTFKRDEKLVSVHIGYHNNRYLLIRKKSQVVTKPTRRNHERTNGRTFLLLLRWSAVDCVSHRIFSPRPEVQTLPNVIAKGRVSQRSRNIPRFKSKIGSTLRQSILTIVVGFDLEPVDTPAGRQDR